MTRDVKDKITVRRDLPTVTMPCSLCGAPLPHSAVEPYDVAKLCFRATIVDRDVWLPIAHAGALCPDPEPYTRAFWDNDVMRENYKRHRREKAAETIRWNT